MKQFLHHIVDPSQSAFIVHVMALLKGYDGCTGLSRNWIEKVVNCVTSVSYSLVLNG